MLTLLDKSDFDNVYEILEQSFPSDERRPYVEQLALMSKKEYKIFVEKVNGEISTFFAIWNFDNFAFVEHFAVKESYRNGGRGSALLCELIKTLDKMVILEVERPNEEMSKRRIGFYERNGFALNLFDYTQPPISKGKNAIKLFIMSTPVPLDEDEYIKIKTKLHNVVYGSEVL